LLRVDHEVKEGIDTEKLVVSNGTNSLLTHSTLVGVPRRLVVMRIWNKTGYGSKYSERFDFEMGGVMFNFILLNGNVGVVLFVTIQILNQTLLQKVVELEVSVL
jgi:hypothetical protein